jgi:subtilisin family serine protease
MQKIYLIALISCFFLISCFEIPKESNIYLHDFTIDTTIEQRTNNFPNYLTTWISSFISPWIDDTTTIHSYLIKTDASFSLKDVQSELASLGIKIGEYIPYHSFIVSATKSQIGRAKRVNGVKWIGPYDSHHKTKIKIKHSTSRKLLSKEEVILFVSVAKHSNKAALQKVANDWTKELKKLVSDAFINMLVVSNEKIALSVLGESAAERAKNFLINQGLVHWVEKKPPTITHNKHSSMLVQSYKRKNDHPVWKRGLTGKGQIIGVGDTGLDYNHCFFHDEKHDVPIQRTMSDKSVKHNGHRKIHSFWAYMDQIDDESGHGSHVVSTISAIIMNRVGLLLVVHMRVYHQKIYPIIIH